MMFVFAAVFSFGTTIVLAAGLLLWLRVFGAIAFHLAIAGVLPVYLLKFLIVALGLAPSGPACWLGASASLLCSGLFMTVLTCLVFENPTRLRSRVEIKGKTGVLLGSLALYSIGDAALQLAAGSEPAFVPCGSAGSTVSSVEATTMMAAAAAMIAYAAVVVFIRRTPAGLLLRASTSNPAAAASLGIDGASVSLFAALMGAVLVGFAGVLVGADSGVRPTEGFRWLLTAAAAIAIGGDDLENGVWPGLLVGSLLVAAVSTAAVWIAGPSWATALVFSMVAAALVWRPAGVLHLDGMER